MARKALDIPWKELIPDREDGPAPMVEIVASGGAATASVAGEQQAPPGDSCSVGALTDHQLAERIDRVRGYITSDFQSRLPDKGAKLLGRLQALHEEQERRRSLAPPAKGKDDEECKEIQQCQSGSSLDSLKSINSNETASQSASESFGFHFSKLFKAKAGGANRDAYCEEISFLHKGHSKSLNELDGKRNTRRMSSRASPFQGFKRFVDKHKQQSHNSHQRNIALPSCSLQLGEKLINHFPKRRKSPENLGTLERKSTEVHAVVLLDEDVQPVEQIQEADEPNERLPSSKAAKIYYPSRDHPECVELCQSDIKCLEPESYLSSTIMNFYIQYLQKSILSSGRPRGEYHFCNTYFYSKLEEALCHKGETGKHFTKLRRWWKGVNIFEKAYIFLPIHRDLHWSLVIICIPAKEEESGPIILHLDSLGFHASNMIFSNIERYLKEEWVYLNDTGCSLDLPISERIWKNLPRRIDRKRITVPQQKNEYDCGLFVLYFMERFIQAAPARLRKKDLAMFGSKWFQPEEASGLRKRLRRLILEEFENHGEESPASHVCCQEDSST